MVSRLKAEYSHSLRNVCILPQYNPFEECFHISSEKYPSSFLKLPNANCLYHYEQVSTTHSIILYASFFCIYIYIYIYIYHPHHDVRPARISLTLSLHVSLLFIAFGRSSGLHPVSSHSSCMNVRAGRPAFDWPYAGVHWSTSLTISSLHLQQCPACLVRLACIVFVIGGR